MQAISLCDDVKVEVSARPQDTEISETEVTASIAPDVPSGVGGSLGKLPQGMDNIAYKAASLALSLWGSGTEWVRIKIGKRIPVAAGLAGGSADAAAATLALARLLAPGACLAEIMEAGAEIGADVPFCIAAAARGNPGLGLSEDGAACSSAHCEGIGDKISPAPSEGGWAVLVKPAIEVSTPQIYSDWDDGGEDAKRRGAGCEGARRETDQLPRNDLAPVAIRRYPLIGRIMDEVKDMAGADRVFMTGSGPTVVAIYADAARASQGWGTLDGAYKNRADVSAVILSRLL
jgi:4-diphosphocytidyl-2-C-methyl-D-erythritol kinase